MRHLGAIDARHDRESAAHSPCSKTPGSCGYCAAVRVLTEAADPCWLPRSTASGASASRCLVREAGSRRLDELVAVRNYSWHPLFTREGMTTAGATPAAKRADRLRLKIQRFVREFGLLADDRTPCGAPLSPREAHALMIVLERERIGDPPRQNDLAVALGIDKSNVTRLVQRLRRDARIQQLQSEDDGRARILRLTPKGRRLAETIERNSRARFETLLAGIPADGQEIVLTALGLLNDAIDTRSPDALR